MRNNTEKQDVFVYTNAPKQPILEKFNLDI